MKNETLLARLANDSTAKFEGRVIIDAMFDNPNFWVRLTLLRCALGLVNADEIGLLGQFSTKKCRQTLRNLGIQKIVTHRQFRVSMSYARATARKLLAATKEPSEILEWELPFNFPAEMVYDTILKKQRKPCVDLSDPEIENLVAEAIQWLSVADRLLTADTKLVVLSHASNHDYGAIAWVAAKRRIPVVVLAGFYGVPRFWRLFEPADIFQNASRPTTEEINSLDADKAAFFSQIGERYLKSRMAGELNDIGAQYAYTKRFGHIDRRNFSEIFGWDTRRPVIAVYAPHWFDSPHLHGMKNFRDFLDWLTVTIDAARKNTSVNWLFKNHPCEDWYGGVTLHDLMKNAESPHMRLVSRDWNNASILRAIDGVITYHGTVGIEAAALGKPVLVADRGWYHDSGFALCANTRQEYIQLLTTSWWETIDTSKAADTARIFAGWYFMDPNLNRGLVLADDSLQDQLYESLPHLLEKSKDAWLWEAQTIHDWFHGQHRHYHIYKMARSDSLSSPGILASA